jgi:hypothetical protein
MDDHNGRVRPLLRSIPAVVVALMVMGVATPTPAHAASGRFVDDDGVPGEPHLEHLAALSVVHGCNPPANTRICPHGTLTRAEAAKILMLAGQAHGSLPATSPGLVDRFVDDDTTWDGSFGPIADFLADQGVVHGCDPPENQRFCPDDTPTIGQLAKIVVGVFRLTAPESYLTPWTDTEGRWYREDARVAAYHGLLDTSSGRFRGGATMDRAQFATMVVRAAGEDRCPEDPFNDARSASLRARHPAVSVTAYAFDTRTGCAYWLHPQARLRTASVFKVMVMAGTLLEAQQDGRPVSSWERSQLLPMITESTNEPVRALWRRFGGSPWFHDQTRIFGMSQTTVVGELGDVPWGRTETSAKDQADLIRQVLLGDWGPLRGPYRAVAWDLMTSVVPSQTWGVTAGVPTGWTVAQKNGFAGGVANSAGFVSAPGSDDGYVVVVLTNGWPTWELGVPLVEEVGGWVSESLAR